jgi:hypothetical protein
MWRAYHPLRSAFVSILLSRIARLDQFLVFALQKRSIQELSVFYLQITLGQSPKICKADVDA